MAEPQPGEILRQIERENVITYKRKEPRSNHKSATDDEDIQSAPSLKASSNPPLPQLGRQKRKMMIKPFGSIDTRPGGFVEKQVRQHDNILLKQRNNMLSNENMKLKTRIAVLEKENQRLQRAFQNESSQSKPVSSYSHGRNQARASDGTMRTMVRQLRREAQDLRKENSSIKTAVKFTSLRELELERDQLAEQTIRLRLALQEEISRRSSIKASMHGVANLEHRVHSLSDKNSQLTRQNAEMHQKLKKAQEGAVKNHRGSDNQKTLNRHLALAKRAIGEKEAEIETLKGQLKQAKSEQPSQVGKMQMRRSSVDRRRNAPTMAGKAHEIKGPSIGGKCTRCVTLEAEKRTLNEKLHELEAEVTKIKGSKAPLGQLPSGPVEPIKEEQVIEVRRFLMLRFRAHRLTHEESRRYLVSCQGQLTAEQLEKEMNLRQLMESLLVEPFCIGSNRYLQVMGNFLFYGGKDGAVLDENAGLKKKVLLEAYEKLVPFYQIISQQKEEQMFVQVAELVTTYYQQILAALTAKRNGQGTIPQNQFLEFFKQIELQQEYIDFIITQIILESLDLEHLNFYAMFEIFYMPQMTAPVTTQPGQPNKNKFQVNQENIVEEEDEEYEESKSHLGSRQKTMQKKEEEGGEEEEAQYGWDEESPPKVPQPPSPIKGEVQIKPEGVEVRDEQQYYEQQYQEQKMNNDESPAAPKAAQYIIQEDFN